jgi:uncharacterized membrane protein HdeD (DUF308 family)
VPVLPLRPEKFTDGERHIVRLSGELPARDVKNCAFAESGWLMMFLAGNWWAFVLRGVIAILFALMVFFMPGMALLTLLYIFGFYAIADGVFNIVGGMHQSIPGQLPWWALLIEGVLGIVAGLVAFLAPGITAIVLLYIIAGWAIATGVMEIVAAIRLRKLIRGEWVLTVAGILSILFGLFIAVFPGPGALAVLFWIGAYAAIFGVLLITLGLRLRTLAPRREQFGGVHGVIPGH